MANETDDKPDSKGSATQTKPPTQAERLLALESGMLSMTASVEAMAKTLSNMEARFHPSGRKDGGDAIVEAIETTRSGDPGDFEIADYDPDSDRFKQYVEDLKFFEEPVRIRLPAQRSKQDFGLVVVQLNGTSYGIRRGTDQIVPRKVVEVLLRSGQSNYTADLTSFDTETFAGGYRYHEHYAPSEEIAIVDDTKRGRGWAAAVAEQERQSVRPL